MIIGKNEVDEFFTSNKMKRFRISDLEKTDNINDGDLLLITINGESKRLTYKQLFDTLYSNIVYKGLPLGTISYWNKENYSRVEHLHDNLYNKTVISEGGGQNLILEYKENGNVKTVKDESRYFQFQEEPVIGTLKFLTKKIPYTSMTSTSYVNTNNFDGWVMADGSTITINNTPQEKERFKQALQLWRTGQSETQFTVPNLMGRFIKISNSNSIVISNTDNSQLGLLKHTHSVSGSISSLNVKIDSGKTSIKTYNSKDAKNSDGVHNGTGTSTNSQGSLQIRLSDIPIPSINLGRYPDQDHNIKPEPEKSVLPVLIYIGGVSLG